MKWFPGRRQRPRIADAQALREFMDGRSAFMVQKSVYEYSRARSGLLSSKLFKEPAFMAAADRARWLNFPLCLQVHAIMVEHTLRPHARGSGDAVRRGLTAIVQDVCSSYPTPPGLDREFWPVAAQTINRRIAQSGLAAPKPVKDLPHEVAEEFFRNMPIHGDLRGFDFELITNNLRVNLCRAHDDLVSAADLPALAADLIGPGPGVYRSVPSGA